MSYLNYDGLAYFKSLLDSYFLKASYNNGSAVIDGNVIFNDGATFKKSITVDSNDLQHPAYIFGNLNGKAKLDWKGQEITSTYIKDISANNNVGTIDYVKGDGTSGNIIIKLMKGATALANGEAGLVPAPASAQKDYFLRGDGIWAVPTDVYVNQSLLTGETETQNKDFPILLSGTSGTPTSKTNATVAYPYVVSVNPRTNALTASQFISKHPSYARTATVTSEVQYTLNFKDNVGNNLGEIVGYIDTPANGGEHQLGFRLFGNPNVQGTEEVYINMGVGVTGGNVAYGYAPETPIYEDDGITKRIPDPEHNHYGEDIITRSWLHLNGSVTGLVHTSMNETIDGIKTFTSETRNTSSAGITTTKLTASGKITGTGTAEISGGSGNTPSLKVTGNETVTGDLSVGGSETVTGNISTTNGTISGKTGSIGTGGLTVTGPSNLNGKVTAGNGLDVTGNTETDTLTVNGNETVGGTLTVTGKITGNDGIDTTTLYVSDDATIDDDLTVGDTIIVNNKILKQDGNTTQEYVSYITNQQETKKTIINNLVSNMIDPDQGLKLVTKGAGENQQDYIAVKLGSGLSFNTEIDTKGQIDVDFKSIPASVRKAIVNGMVDAEGALIGCEKEFIPGGETYRYYDDEGILREATAPEGGIDNPNYGRLTVDFSQMPQDSFIELMSSMIDAQQISSSGGGNHFYVDGINGHDTDAIVEKGHVNSLTALKNLATDNLEVGDYYTVGSTNAIRVWKGTSWGLPSASSRGTPAAPFKTIQACVNLITKVYKFNTTNAYINCQNINETTQLTLPSFDRTTATIIIRACTFTDSTTRGGGTLVSLNPTDWNFTDDDANVVNAKTAEQKKDDYLYPLKISLQPSSGNRHCVETNGTGVWSLYNFNLIFDDTLWRTSGGHQSPLCATDYSNCKVTACRFEFKRSEDTFWTNALTTGQHCIFVSSYALCEINRYVKIVGEDYTVDVSVNDSNHTWFTEDNTGNALPAITGTSNFSVGDLYRVAQYTDDDNDPATASVLSGYKYYFYNDAGNFEQFTNPFKRVLNAIQIGDRATVRIQDTRTIKDNNDNIIDDRAVFFKGSFRALVSCSSIFVRNLAYMGKANTEGVANTDYRFYIYAGGYVRLEDSGKLDYVTSVTASTNNNVTTYSINYTPRCQDTWLGTRTENDEVIDNTDPNNPIHSTRTSSVERTTNSWYK